jgi:hypothetical protein
MVERRNQTKGREDLGEEKVAPLPGKRRSERRYNGHAEDVQSTGTRDASLLSRPRLNKRQSPSAQLTEAEPCRFLGRPRVALVTWGRRSRRRRRGGLVLCLVHFEGGRPGQRPRTRRCMGGRSSNSIGRHGRGPRPRRVGRPGAGIYRAFGSYKRPSCTVATARSRSPLCAGTL